MKDTFEKYFVTPHDLTFDQVASMFDIHYDKVTTSSDLKRTYNDALSHSRSSLIELALDPTKDYDLHSKIRQRIATVVKDI